MGFPFRGDPFLVMLAPFGCGAMYGWRPAEPARQRGDLRGTLALIEDGVEFFVLRFTKALGTAVAGDHYGGR